MQEMLFAISLSMRKLERKKKQKNYLMSLLIKVIISRSFSYRQNNAFASTFE